MQAITNDARYRPSLEMIAENHNLRRETDKQAREREVIVNAWCTAGDDCADWKRRYNEECETTRKLSAEIARLSADNSRLKRIATRKGSAAYKKEGWWKRCLRSLSL